MPGKSVNYFFNLPGLLFDFSDYCAGAEGEPLVGPAGMVGSEYSMHCSAIAETELPLNGGPLMRISWSL